MRILIIFLVCFLTACSTQQGPEKKSLLQIKEISPNRWTNLTRQNLEHLIQIYDLKPLIFTKKIQIQSRVISHSHPILTLNTRYANQPYKILSTLLHEELHWWAESKDKQINLAIKELKRNFPVIPKKGGARNAHSTYLHLVICYLEYKALTHYLGNKEANKIIKEFMLKDKIYPWVYRQVLNKYHVIKKVAKKFDLEPIPLKS